MNKLNQIDDEGPISDINIIPFVDIALVLLIIFMVTSTTIVRSALRVDLPKAASAGEAVSTTLNLVFSSDGDLFLDGQPILREELTATVKAVTVANPDTQAVISADKSNPYGDVVALIDLVKLGGVQSFALNIERVAPPASTASLR